MRGELGLCLPRRGGDLVLTAEHLILSVHHKPLAVDVLGVGLNVFMGILLTLQIGGRQALGVSNRDARPTGNDDSIAAKEASIQQNARCEGGV
jgi:hypothetical protein